MEAEKDSKTLEEGSVKSKQGQSQNPCNQLEKACDVSKLRKNINESVLAAEESGSGNSGGIDVNNGTNEVSKIFGCGHGLEGFENKEVLISEDVAEEDERKESFLGPGIEKEILVQCRNGIKNGDVSAVEVVQMVSEDVGIGIEKDTTVEAMEKSDGALQLHEPDSSRKIEISGDGISLFVEVFGPLDGIDPAEEGKCSEENVLGEDDSDEQYSSGSNGTLLSHIGEDEMAKVSETHAIQIGTEDEASKVNELVDMVCACKEDCNFAVGDLVWAETKTKLWWPGVICDPSNASKDSTVGSNPRGSFLVAYFGNAYLVWRSPSKMKHFFEYFEQMTQQINSRCFHGAVERAISEIGRHVKEEMTCSCFSKDSQTFAALSDAQNVNHSSQSKGKIGELCAFSSSQFEPASFLSSIKHLAQDVSWPGKISLTISQNCLSAFYRFLGHCQLPMHQLGLTDAKHGAQNDLKVEDLTNARSGGKKKPNSSILMPNSEVGIRGCSGKIETSPNCQIISSVIEQWSALKSPIDTEGNLLSGRNSEGSAESEKGNELRERKKSKYLSYPYVNPSEDKKGMSTSSKKETEELKKVSSAGKNSQKKGSRNSSCGVDGNLENLNLSSAEMLSELHLKALDCSYYKEKRYFDSIKRFFSSFRRFAFLNHDIANISNGDNQEPVAHLSSSSKPSEYERIGSDATKSEKVSRKRKKVAKVSGISKIETVAPLPDLNANNTTLPVEGLQVTGDAPSQGKLGQKKRKRKQKSTLESSCSENVLSWMDMNGKCVKFVPLLKAVEAAGANFLKSIPQQNNMEAEPDAASELMVRQSEANQNHVEFGSPVKTLQQTQISAPSAIPERKKRKRRDKKSKLLNNEVTSSIPDLNGHSAASNLIGNNVPDLNTASPKDKPRQKRRRTKSSIAVPDSNVNHNMVHKDVELPGAILLNFAAGYPLPSIESLFTTFSVYGSLKESETRFLDDSSAQVVFLRSSDAAKALGNLQQSNPFGPALAGFRFHQLPAASSTPKPSFNTQTPQPFSPMDGLKTPTMPSGLIPQSGDTPDLFFIKQNLEMMTSMLEKAGNNLSPEMRAKLETEIKGFMKKVNSMVGSSSS